MESLQASNQADSEYPPIFKEQDAAGFPSISKSGETIQDPANAFIETLDLAREKGGSSQEDYEHMYNTLKKDPKTIEYCIFTIICFFTKTRSKRIFVWFNFCHH